VIAVLPSRKTTFPEIGTTPVPLVGPTVAVKVTDWFTAEGLADDVSEVVVAAALTVCEGVRVAVVEEKF
jgi:hypothetical protein